MIEKYLRILKGLYNREDIKKIVLAYILEFPCMITNQIVNPTSFSNVGLFGINTALLLMVLSSTIGDESDFKDVKKIRKLYEEVLSNYVELNKKFSLKNPVELCTFFGYTYTNGFLSKNKTFIAELDNKKLIDTTSLYGANVINGFGCCRHIATMFTEFLRIYGIDSNSLIIEIDGEKQELYRMKKLLETAKKSQQELIKNGMHGNQLDENILSLNKAIKVKTKELKNRQQVKTNYHAITMSVQDDICYLLAPTNVEMYEAKDESHISNGCEKSIPVIYELIKQFNRIENIDDIIQHITLPNIGQKQADSYIKQTLEKCLDNKDIFEKFYKDNHELYEEVSDKLLKLKQKEKRRGM